MAVGGPGDNVLFPKSGEKASQADCLQLIVFYPSVFCKATRPPQTYVLPWALKRETEEGTLSWDTGSWGGPRYPFMRSFIVCLLSVVPGMILVFVLGIEDKQSWASRSSCSRKGR